MAILFPHIKELKESGKSGILFPIAQKLSGSRVPQITQRYFTQLSAAGGQHYTIPSVTPDTVEMTVMSPTGSTVGLPTGATAPTAGKLQTISFAYSGDPIIYIGRNGSNYFSGYIADVKFISGGNLVRHYPLDDDGTTSLARELVSGEGENIYTPSVIQNPVNISPAWANNGDGSFSLNGNGTYQGLTFLFSSAHPKTAIIELEVESLVGGDLRIAGPELIGSNRIVPEGFVGVWRFFYSVSQSENPAITFARNATGQVVTATIKNIKCIPTPSYGTRVNLTQASTELFTKTNDTWVNGDGTKVLEIAQ
jgi:hypothetical protein